jgi:hypothetical protein
MGIRISRCPESAILSSLAHYSLHPILQRIKAIMRAAFALALLALVAVAYAQSEPNIT